MHTLRALAWLASDRATRVMSRRSFVPEPDSICSTSVSATKMSSLRPSRRALDTRVYKECLIMFIMFTWIILQL